MRKMIYILPLLSLLCQVVEPAGRNLGIHVPFYSLPMLLTLAFMALSIAPWNENVLRWRRPTV